MKFDVAHIKAYKGRLFMAIEHYLSTQHTDVPPHCVIGGSRGAGKSTLTSQLEADAHVLAAADQLSLVAMPAALLVVDAQLGVTTTVRRDCLLLSLMGVRRLGVVVNKMDATGYSQARFDEVVREFQAFSASLPLPEATFIPVAALQGDNVLKSSDNTSWYTDTSVLGFLEALVASRDAVLPLPFRLSVERIADIEAGTRGFSGSIISGVIRPGDDVRVQPSGSTGRVAQVLTPDGAGADRADAGQVVTLMLVDDLAISRGDLISGIDQPAQTADQFEAGLIWNSNEPLLPGRPYDIRLGSQSAVATVTSIKYQINTNTLEHMAAKQLPCGGIGVCNLSLNREVAFDPFHESPPTGSFMLLDRVTGRSVGTGMFNFALRRSQNIHRQHLDIDKQARALAKSQKPAVLWFTGLSGAGKSTIANLVEKKLFAHGQHTYLLDGDNVRHGLNRDLGFTDADRVENVRRVAEAARLMVDAGLIVMSAFISPFRSERQLARDLLEEGEFIEIYVDAPLNVVEARDPKGLYKKARRGEIKNFTGIDSAYEAPNLPDIHLKTEHMSPENAADTVMQALRERGMIS